MATIPGVAAAALIALVAVAGSGRIAWLSPVVLAMAAGVLLGNLVPAIREPIRPGVDLCLSLLLRSAIVLMGLQFSLTAALAVGGSLFLLVLIIVLAGLIAGLLTGRLLGLGARLSLLIGAGTSICGATAVATIAPLIDADERDVALAMGTIFLFNTLALLSYPLLGALLGLSQPAFGTWVGVAIHDTSSVLAAGFLYGDQAGLTATLVKLTRTTFLVPLALVLAFGGVAVRGRPAGRQGLLARMPWFILGFLLLALVGTAGWVPEALLAGAKSLAKGLIVVVLAAAGLNLNLSQVRAVGWRLVAAGLIASVAVGGLGLALIYGLGIA